SGSMADPNSFSSFSQCTTKHLNLQLQVDFESRVVKGTVALTVEALKDQLSSLILDTKDLKIFKVVVDGKEVNFSLGTKHAFNGTPLEITLPFALERGQHVIVRITYETSPTAFALQWLTPEQTAGKKHPYLFSQCQIYSCTAALICCVYLMYSTYTRVCIYKLVSVPSELVVAMSAKRDGERPDPQDNTRKIYRFRQTVPMPCYLIAIVVGALESRVIGPRTRVWSEKEYIDQAAFEFSETETMLKVAEDLAGPYVWGQYDLLVLPPSFPYGGMENPCLTFVTPTLLAGDKSLSNVIAHEISHSWTGNLVTNQTWEHFWYAYTKPVLVPRHFDARILCAKYQSSYATGPRKTLCSSVWSFLNELDFTKYMQSSENAEPIFVFNFSSGFTISLTSLDKFTSSGEGELSVLQRQQNIYLSSWAPSCISKGLSHLYRELVYPLTSKASAYCPLYMPTVPPCKGRYDTTLADACITLCQRWSKATESDLSSFTAADLEKMSSHQKVEFLALLLLEVGVKIEKFKRFNSYYNIYTTQSSFIKFRWLRLCIRARWEEAIPLAVQMATEQGRMKFTRPLFRDLYNFDKSRELAVSTFLKHRSCMHPVTALLVGKDLGID
uniref:Leukotriene A4 hydrolase n=1 Tax=Latimeria chalumnae TaxID=7897 RepID=H3BAN2_LATCH